jgi:Tol biopolymer transport system component
LLDAETGERTVPVTAEELCGAYAAWVEREFGEAPISIFFPILSPDERRVFLKVAMPGNTHFRSWEASKRKGLIVYDIERARFLSMREDWGHPAWHPDSRTMLNVPNLLIDVQSGTEKSLGRLPRFPGSHPSFSPDGRLFVTDTRMEPFGGTKDEWGIVVVEIAGQSHTVVARFENSGGATSWRPPHPHPVFSPDGQRIYFNQNSGAWTRLMVAEAR